MIKIDEIRQILKDSKLYVKENDKNFVCVCPYCGDHRNKLKQGHLYASKDETIPTYHCWYCNTSGPLTKFLFDITGKTSDNLLKIETKPKEKIVSAASTRFKQFKLPVLDTLAFPLKSMYMRTRTFGKLDIQEIPNLIFDTDEFFRINNIDPVKDLKLSNWEVTLLQHNFVVFLSKHQTMLYARNINKETKIKFRKIYLQSDSEKMLDYYEIDLHHPNSDTVILSEGNFDILGCYAHDSLKLNDSANCYASGCTFSYAELLKSVCYDKSIYAADVHVLSDNDKQQWHYKKFIKTAYTAKNIEIVYNRFGKDFGVKVQQSTKVF